MCPRWHDFIGPTLAMGCKVVVGWTTMGQQLANWDLAHLTWVPMLVGNTTLDQHWVNVQLTHLTYVSMLVGNTTLGQHWVTVTWHI